MPAKSTKSPATPKPRRASARKRPASERTSAKRYTPDHGEIAERAYFIHLEDGCSDEMGNWLRAERELTTA